jgi:ATP-binding cassette subfamily C (CFTR/MRP) protein 4
LDPFGQYDEEQLWSALEAVELKSTIQEKKDKLDATVLENGRNLSFGQKQLLCLARAVLKNSKLLVMDESTSSIDLKTDQLIQKAIRKRFENNTVITIAHRLDTIIDYDYIIVLDQGQVVEFGTPKVLISKDPGMENAWFARMVAEMGPSGKEALVKMIRHS